MGLENAGRYSPPGSEVRFTVAREGEHALFRVDDAGPGIAPQERERAFEKFTRLPRDPSSPGSGLGLYIARTLTRLNGGTLTLAGAPSGGTAFEIRLPALSRP